jgi:polygalacturonase
MKFMLRTLWINSCVVAIWLAGVSTVAAQATLPSDFSVPLPGIPRRSFNIIDFGAVGDGRTFNTSAIAKAIAACDKAGGGTVNIPAGKFLTGPFLLASNLNLHLEKGSAILFSGNPKDFALDDGTFQNCMMLEDGHDIAITGPGAIDGQGALFWRHYVAPKNENPEFDDLTPRRPRLIQLTGCSRVLVQDVTLMNSPSFHLVPAECQNVTIERVHIKSPALSPNTDGIDPSGINFVIRSCNIDTGDDCIAVKAGAQYDPDRPACENFLITDSTFYHGHGMSVGSQTYGGLRNMLVSNCTFDGTEAGIRLKSSRGRGGLVEYVTYEHLLMKNVKNSILITSYYPKIPPHLDMDPGQDGGTRTPIWRHIRISDVTSTNSLIAVQIVGLQEMPIEDVLLTNVNISAFQPIEIAHAAAIRFVGCKISATSSKPIIVDASVEGLK